MPFNITTSYFDYQSQESDRIYFLTPQHYQEYIKIYLNQFFECHPRGHRQLRLENQQFACLVHYQSAAGSLQLPGDFLNGLQYQLTQNMYVVQLILPWMTLMKW